MLSDSSGIFAKEHNLEKMSDLLAISNDVILGCTAEFLHREDCLPGLEAKNLVQNLKM